MVDVRAASGAATFRTELAWQYDGFGEAGGHRRPLPDGDVVSVFCDVKRQKAKWDDNDPRVWKPGKDPLERKKAPDEFERAAAAPPGTPMESDAITGTALPVQVQESIHTATVSLPPHVAGKKTVGQRVTYRVVASGESETRTIVAVQNALDRAPDEITSTSPKAKALDGHAVGDRVTGSGNFGEPLELEILAIDQPPLAEG